MKFLKTYLLFSILLCLVTPVSAQTVMDGSKVLDSVFGLSQSDFQKQWGEIEVSNDGNYRNTYSLKNQPAEIIFNGEKFSLNAFYVFFDDNSLAYRVYFEVGAGQPVQVVKAYESLVGVLGKKDYKAVRLGIEAEPKLGTAFPTCGTDETRTWLGKKNWPKFIQKTKQLDRNERIMLEWACGLTDTPQEDGWYRTWISKKNVNHLVALYAQFANNVPDFIKGKTTGFVQYSAVQLDPGQTDENEKTQQFEK